MGQRFPKYGEKAVSFVSAVRVEQLFSLVDGEDDGWRLRIGDEPFLCERLQFHQEAIESARLFKRLAEVPGISLLRDPLEGGLQAGDEACGACDDTPIWPDSRQRPEVAIVAFQPRPQSRSQVGGFACSRCPENHKEPFDSLFSHEPELVEAPYDRGIAPEKDGRILGLQRFEPPIGIPLGIVGRRPGKGGGAQARFLEALVESCESFPCEGDVSG